jgi:hypothetical protein
MTAVATCTVVAATCTAVAVAATCIVDVVYINNNVYTFKKLIILIF